MKTMLKSNIEDIFSSSIFIEGITTEAIIGIYAYEKIKPQPLIVDVTLAKDFNQVINSNNIEDTVDYASVAEEVDNYIRKSNVELLETLAYDLSQHLLKNFAVDAITLKINKPLAVKNSKAVGIIYTAYKK